MRPCRCVDAAYKWGKKNDSRIKQMEGRVTGYDSKWGTIGRNNAELGRGFELYRITGSFRACEYVTL